MKNEQKNYKKAFVFRFNQGLYEKLSLKRKEKVKGVENETTRF